MLKKVICTLLALATVITLLGGCNSAKPQSSVSGSQNPVTLKLWHMWPEQTAADSNHMYLKRFADEYHKLHPNVTVEVTGGQTPTKILTALTSGEGPDLFVNYWNNISQWSAKGALADITSFANNDKTFDKSDFLSSTLERATFNNVLYGVPFWTASSEIYYNKDLFKKAGIANPPVTMEDLEEDIDKLTIKDSSGAITQLGMLPDYPWRDDVLWPVVFGANWINTKTNKITFNTPEMIAAYQWQADVYKKYGYDNLIKYKAGFGSNAQNPFLAGKIAMCFQEENFIGQIQTYAPNMNYGICAMPYPKDHPELKNTVFVALDVVNMSAKCSDKNAAWGFMNYMTSPAKMIDFANGQQGMGVLMARKSALRKLPPAAPEGLKEVANFMLTKTGKGFPQLAYTNEYLTAISDQMTLAMSGKQTVEQAAAKVVQTVQPLADANPVKSK